MVNVISEFIAAGANRHPSAADWDRGRSGLLAFGANNNIAIWDPLDATYKGIKALLPGHTETVNAVSFLPASDTQHLFVSGSADKTLRLWTSDSSSSNGYRNCQVIADHQGSINCIAAVANGSIFVTGAADATVKVWRTHFDEAQRFAKVEIVQDIKLEPKYFPLAIAVAELDDGSLILAVAGTKTNIQIYVSTNDQFTLAATLTGHEAWIRSLAFTRETSEVSSDLLLASASQDKYIRLWRIHPGEELPMNAAADPALGALGKSLSNKAHRFQSAKSKYSLTFEALLLGHEDWIYTTKWQLNGSKLQLLSASADNSLAIWEPDAASGVWICTTRLGEISSQKGSTTATGSAGGFWAGFWAPDGSAVVSMGRSGSWRLWKHDSTKDIWLQDVAITGHTKEVRGACWSTDSAYIISTSSDQTTRLFSEANYASGRSWHEFSRPQIHGYDLNCVSSISPSRFVSGADEKLLRVFDEPSAVAGLLDRLCDIRSTNVEALPDAANIPVLGLSNKAIQAVEDDQGLQEEDNETEAIDPASVVHKSTLDIRHPPYEDHLARHLLWPESEKLYGHGYEISAVAASHDGTIVATACKASSIDHAVIRLYDTAEWREIKPALTAHSLTVTSLAFSDDDQYLLSVGRDRQWAIFERSTDTHKSYELYISNPKGHTRMILDCAWAPGTTPRIFATAGRDKSVKIWKLEGKEASHAGTCTVTTSATAVSFCPTNAGDAFTLAFGSEDGAVTICRINKADLAVTSTHTFDRDIAPSKTINKLSWRGEPLSERTNGASAATPGFCASKFQLAVASDDASLRIYSTFDMENKG